MILEQAQEQRERGEISEAQYQHMANQLRLFTEQEQIREARERERMLQPPPQQMFKGVCLREHLLLFVYYSCLFIYLFVPLYVIYY